MSIMVASTSISFQVGLGSIVCQASLLGAVIGLKRLWLGRLMANHLYSHKYCRPVHPTIGQGENLQLLTRVLFHGQIVGCLVGVFHQFCR